MCHSGRERPDEERRKNPLMQTRAEAYRLIENTVRRLGYFRLGRADKGALRRFLARATGFSRAQITRLLNQYRSTGRLADRRHATPHSFARRYTDADVELLAEVDALHGTLSGPAARKLCIRACHLFGDLRFERLAGISNGHLYNLRRSKTYRRRRGMLSSPRLPVPYETVDYRRLQPSDAPGRLRVVSVRRSPRAGREGLYHLHLVDEVTQFQLFGSVEHLRASCLAPVLDSVRKTFPFNLQDFHGGDGGASINHDVAALLGSLPDRRQAGGCARGRYAERVNAFNREVFSPYLNYHRLRCFPTEQVDAGGAVHRRYRDADIMTPYERLRSLPGAAACLTPGTTFAALDAVAMAMSDSEAALAVSEAGERLVQGRPAAQRRS